MILCVYVGLCVNMCVHSKDRKKKYFKCKDVCVCVCVYLKRERERARARAAFLGVPESFPVVPHSTHFFETFLTRSSSTCVKRSRSFLLTRNRDQLVSNAFVASSSHTPHTHRSLPSLPSANQSVLWDLISWVHQPCQKFSYRGLLSALTLTCFRSVERFFTAPWGFRVWGLGFRG